MDAPRPPRASTRMFLIGIVGAGMMLLMVIWMIVWQFLIDTVPGFVRMSAALIGLDEYQADLLERLNAARGDLACTLAPPDSEPELALWDAYINAARRCWETGLAPWRIKLAGGELALQYKPNASTAPST